MTNAELLKKADMTLADLATAGHLNPEQANVFLRKLMNTPTILTSARSVIMKAPERKIPKIGFGTRMLRRGQSGVALTEDQRYKPGLEQVVLKTDEVIAEIHLPYDVFEDNIEGGNVAAGAFTSPGGLHTTIVELMAQRAAVDLEELGLLGDTTNATDDYLAMTDGWLKRANQNIVDAGGATFDRPVIKKVVKTMPDKYLRNRAALKHFVSVDNETELRDRFGDRNTPWGDTQVQGITPLYAHGSQIIGASGMPGTDGLFTDPQNLIFGIQRDIQIEYDKDISKRVFIVVLTARVAFQIEEAEAIVRTRNITA
ncbi:phage major capsid protein [Burkholderia ubonensis]|uniref:phage major capsid protein n=1 Tax=Burkholderia ubonensis TaxID=101571 RepID=UPI0007C7E7AA|nr:phage major capsid protein [Burkholderia ubonensis]